MNTADPMKNLPVRKCSILCVDHPEWGTFGVMEDRGDYYEIHGDRGGRILSKDEASKSWALAPGSGPVWIEKNGTHKASFGNVLLGQCHIRIKQVGGRFNAGYIAADHCRFDAPTILGNWDNLEEAKRESVKTLRSLPWCPEGVR